MDAKSIYEQSVAKSHEQRIKWWREARLGMFIHYGLYSVPGRMEWMQAYENIPKEEYEKYADCLNTKPGAVREWVKLAKESGMKYAVLTTRHHEGFSLWDSKVNPFNSVNYGPHRDIVREFVDACREFGMRIGFYSSLMDWHHPDGYNCLFDAEARKRFLQYIEDLNVELLSNYGKIDILWYDMPHPLRTAEEWNSAERNRKLRELQPEIIINNRSYLDEDFGTPEGKIKPEENDWEACMTFNGISWGYVDEIQANQYAYSAPQIIHMLQNCCRNGGNLLLNIGPKSDGSVPNDVLIPLKNLGAWLTRNQEAVYGEFCRKCEFGGNGIGKVTCSADKKTVYVWHRIWPQGGEMGYGGYKISPKKISILATGQEVKFSYSNERILLSGLPEEHPDPTGVTIVKMEFDEVPDFKVFSLYPHREMKQVTNI